MVTKTKGMGELFKEVIDSGLCTLCGACVGGCPYTVFYKGRIRMLDYCSRQEGQCYEYCPRTYTDLDAISNKYFGAPFTGSELGNFTGIFMVRAKDSKIRSRAQYGGTVTALLSFAIESGEITNAITVKTGNSRLPEAWISQSASDLTCSAGSNYMAYPVLEALNRQPKGGSEKIGVVVTPCQATALAKMVYSPPEQRVSMANINLVIGLFCTWALSYQSFYEYLKSRIDLSDVRKFDIPPPPASRFDMYTDKGIQSLALDEVRQYRMPACSFCMDMTAEFSDISVGSVEGVEGWNTVIVRTERGSRMLESAKKKAKIEIQKIPDASVVHLKEASLHKKARCLQEIVKKTGNKDDLMYLKMDEDIRERLLKLNVSGQGGH